MPARLARLALVLLVASLAGCGAFIARTKIFSAEEALAGAKRAGADQKSVYEYTGAQLYLEKAREEEAYGRFGPAIDFGDTATKLADQARLNASTAEPDAPPPEP